LFAPRGPQPLAARPAGAIVFGRWEAAAGGAGEELVVVRRGEDELEIHCHGGIAASEAVIASLEQRGAERQAWPDWLRAGGISAIEVEAREAMAVAGGPKAARILARQSSGMIETEFAIVERLFADGRMAEARAAVDRLFRASRVGLRLTRPWRVVLAGSVNAGKSSLVNALTGHARAIVSPEPGTTRDLLETRVVLEGWEVDLIDAAGMREEGGDDRATAVERAGIARAIAAREGADLVLHVVDGRHLGSDGPTVSAERALVVASKADLAGGAAAAALAGTLWTSAVTGEGIAELAVEIVRRLLPEEAEDPELLAGAVPFTERQVAWMEQKWQQVCNLLNPASSTDEMQSCRHGDTAPAYSSFFSSFVRPRT